MSKKTRLVLPLLIAVLVTAGYWYYAHRSASQPVVQHGPEVARPSAPPTPTNVNPPAASKEANVEVEKKSTPVPPLPVLRSGEVLEYAVNIAKLNSTIANISLAVREQKNIAGRPAWHLQAFAHTENPYRMVFELDDQFDSFSELAALTSLQYEMHLSERGEKVDSVQRLLSSTKEAAPAGQSAARVLPGTRDPLGMLHYLRNVDWSKTTEVRSPVYDGHKLYDVRAVLRGRSETVTVPAGGYSASRIEIHVLDNGAEMKDTHFLLYLSNDATHTPVLMEAVLPIATARVELTKVK
jgi:hypothetical protein